MVKSAKTTARQRAEQARLARERAAARARRVRSAWWAIAAAPALVVLLLLIKLATPAPSGPAPAENTALSATTMAGLSPGASTLDNAGRGRNVTFPKKVDGQPALTKDGKPWVLYIGAEYCPFCASQRWPLVIALSRFGTFTGLTNTHSGSDDVFPNTPTISFHGATYTSDLLTFTGVETNTNKRQGNGYAPLDTLTAEEQQVLNTYDAPPYVDASSQGAVPFVDFGNQFLQTGASYSPQLLAGLSQDQVASAIIGDPTGQVAQSILGAANAFTGILCKLTGGQPGDVCTSTGATAYQTEVNGG
jgi:hypothetical protein